MDAASQGQRDGDGDGGWTSVVVERSQGMRRVVVVGGTCFSGRETCSTGCSKSLEVSLGGFLLDWDQNRRAKYRVDPTGRE